MSDSLEFKLNSKHLQDILKISLRIIEKYAWLIDAYVLDFYVDDHWSKLPNAWRNHLGTLKPEELANIIRGDVSCSSVRPLSVLCLNSLMRVLCISREVKGTPPVAPNRSIKSLLEHQKLRNIFTKCVKPKKRHEIDRMASVCYKSVLETSVDFVVDFGAGLGHLARLLGYEYGVQVCCLEMQGALNDQARLIDSQLEITASKHLTPEEKQHFRRPVHITLKLTKHVTANEFLGQIKQAMFIANDAPFSFGIIGLHPCGDLCAILIDLFLSCKEAKFLNFVGCCYMKLSTGLELIKPGYPLSDFLKNADSGFSHLSYESREIACHALEVYCDRLGSGNYENLKVHSFRAITEKILMKYWPELKHTGLRSVKHTKGMDFEDYVKTATKGLDIDIPKEDMFSETTLQDLEQWKRIVIFYSMRLLFAPLVESVILYDRILYLKERGCSVYIAAIFDPHLSPRNHITSAVKRNE